MGRIFSINLEGRIYRCKHCQAHLCVREDIISRSFHCKNGKAYLFGKIVNVAVGEEVDRMMITGMHTVRDIFCVGCGAILGWRYEAAHEKSQRYKEGKFILERYSVMGPTGRLYNLNSNDSSSSDEDDP